MLRKKSEKGEDQGAEVLRFVKFEGLERVLLVIFGIHQ
jgi:hypothetical protein